MLTDTQIENLKKHPGIGWISCLRAPQIRKLVEEGILQLSLFDERHLAELTVEETGERFIACFNPLLADERARKRQELLDATERDLEKIQREIARRTRKSLTRAEIGTRVGRVLYHYKMGKKSDTTLKRSSFRSEVNLLPYDKLICEIVPRSATNLRVVEVPMRLSPVLDPPLYALCGCTQAFRWVPSPCETVLEAADTCYDR